MNMNKYFLKDITYYSNPGKHPYSSIDILAADNSGSAYKLYAVIEGDVSMSKLSSALKQIAEQIDSAK